MALPLTITFLGTGTSQGVPMIGCQCAVCKSTDPRDNRTRSSIYISTPDCAWVIDTGPEFRIQCLREGITRLDAVVYTHAHTDHMVGFDDLRPFCSQGRDLPIYASAQTMEDLRRMFGFAFGPMSQIPGYVRPSPRIVDGPFELCGITLTPLSLPHGRTIVNAYLSDCKSVPESVLAKIHGVETLIVDALRHAEHPTHMSVTEAIAVSRIVAPRETWFTHICHDLGHAATEATLPPGVRLAYDGLKLTFQ